MPYISSMERGVKVNILGFQTNKKRKTKKSVDLEEFENLSRILKPEKQKQVSTQKSKKTQGKPILPIKSLRWRD